MVRPVFPDGPEVLVVGENKRKQKQENESKIAFIYLSESGLFNGLQPIQIENFSLLSIRPHMSRVGVSLRPAGNPARRRLDPIDQSSRD
jgi:hypothetical protein